MLGFGANNIRCGVSVCRMEAPHHNSLASFPTKENMTSRYPVFFLSLFAASALSAQCDYTPTITPTDVILCPEGSATLSTQAYDSYQWFKEGSPIAGATGQTLVVEHFADAGYMFTVQVSLDGCTATSAAVLVDGWAFLMPYVIHGGDEPLNQGPVLNFCDGDTLTLSLSPGYTENITWFRNGEAIAGETSPELFITTSGAYTVTGAPTVCPNSIQGIGLDIETQFLPLMRPDIVDLGDQICVYPVGNSTQWYLAGVSVATTDCIVPSSSGPYTAFVDYGQPCQGLSDPWMSTGIAGLNGTAMQVSPVPASTELHVSVPLGGPGEWLITDMLGRPVLRARSEGAGNAVIEITPLAPGNYLLLDAARTMQPARIVVAR